MLGIVGAEPSEVDDAAQAGVGGGRPEIGGGNSIEVGEVLSRCHRVDQIQRRLAPRYRFLHRRGIEKVTLHHFDPMSPRMEGKLRRGTGETPDLIAGVEQPGDDASSDVAGGAGDENAHGRANLGAKQALVRGRLPARPATQQPASGYRAARP